MCPGIFCLLKSVNSAVQSGSSISAETDKGLYQKQDVQLPVPKSRVSRAPNRRGRYMIVFQGAPLVIRAHNSDVNMQQCEYSTPSSKTDKRNESHEWINW